MIENTMNFDSACRRLIDSGAVVASSHIADVLKAVAASREIMSVVTRCAEGFDFESEFNRSKVPLGTSEYRLMPPTQITDFVAYSFGVLLHIDLGSISLPTLLATYYRDADVNVSFQRFTMEIVDKFRRAIEALCDESPAAEDNQPPVREVRIDGDGVKELTEILTECVNTISELDLPLRKKEEMLVVCDGLSRALKLRDKADTYVNFVGFKYAVGTLPPLGNHVETVDNLIRRYEMI